MEEERGANGGARSARSFGRPLGRVGRFVREHPLAALAIAAGAGTLGGIEWCAGALLGGGIAALVTRQTGRDLREKLRHSGSELVGRARDRLGSRVTRPTDGHVQEPGGEHAG